MSGSREVDKNSQYVVLHLPSTPNQGSVGTGKFLLSPCLQLHIGPSIVQPSFSWPLPFLAMLVRKGMVFDSSVGQTDALGT